MLNYYKKTEKFFKKYIKENPYCTKEEWDKYAQENCLFSANTLMFHLFHSDLIDYLNRKNTNKFEYLKNMFLWIPIRTVEYPKENAFFECYKKSYLELRKITEDFKKFPNVEEWNKYAKENNLLSHVSMEYISKLNWKYLKIKVERELNFKVIKKI